MKGCTQLKKSLSNNKGFFGSKFKVKKKKKTCTLKPKAKERVNWEKVKPAIHGGKPN